MRKILGLVWVGLLLTSMVASAQEAGGDAAKEQIKELKTQQRQLRTKLMACQKKFQKDEEIVALRKAAAQANKAVQDKIKEKTLADPEGAAILQEMEALTAKMKELMPKKVRKPRAPKRKKKEGGGDMQM